jgi:hypothetical protein
MSTALILGVGLAVLCLCYVLYPIVGGGRASAPRSSSSHWPQAPRTITDEAIEAAIKAYRATLGGGGGCTVCGPRPEPDAVFCSSCGRRLSGEG